MLTQGQAFRFTDVMRDSASPPAGLDSTDQPRTALPDARRPLANSPAACGESLPFRVAIVDSEADLQRVQQMRQAAYGHHLPALAAHFGQPDPIDRWPDVTIFYAEDKATGQLVGSARLQCNGSQPLQIERCLELPQHLGGRLLVEVTRLVVMAGYVHPVKLAMVKAIHLFCVAMQAAGILAGSRPSLMRQYMGLGFEDLFGDGRLVPLAYAGGLDHRVLFRDTVNSQTQYQERLRPGYDFVFRTYHPDIEVFSALARMSEPLRQVRAAHRPYMRPAQSATELGVRGLAGPDLISECAAST